MKDNRVALEIGYQLEDSDNRKIKINSDGSACSQHKIHGRIE